MFFLANTVQHWHSVEQNGSNHKAELFGVELASLFHFQAVSFNGSEWDAEAHSDTLAISKLVYPDGSVYRFPTHPINRDIIQERNQSFLLGFHQNVPNFHTEIFLSLHFYC